MRFARSLARPAKVGRKSGGSRAVARIRFPFRTAPLFAGTPLRCKGPPGRFRGFGGDFGGFGIRTLSCGLLCGGVCFSAGSSAAAARVLCCSSLCGTCGRPSAPSVSPVLRPVRATRCGCRLLRSLRPASAPRFSHRRPAFPPRFDGPASRLAPAARCLCSSGRRTGPPGPVPSIARSGSAHRPCGGALRPPARHRGLAEPFPARRPVRIVGNNP